MNEVNKTLFIPLYGKSWVSKRGIILSDPMAEKIWETERFPIRGKSKSKWLTYNMAMRARVFDDWTEDVLKRNKDALVLHLGCGLDGRCLRIKAQYANWIDGDFPEVISLRRKYYKKNGSLSHEGNRCIRIRAAGLASRQQQRNCCSGGYQHVLAEQKS